MMTLPLASSGAPVKPTVSFSESMSLVSLRENFTSRPIVFRLFHANPSQAGSPADALVAIAGIFRPRGQPVAMS
jgi:hypothetical protein